MQLNRAQADLVLRLVVAHLNEDDTGNVIQGRYDAAVEASYRIGGRRLLARDTYHRILRDHLQNENPPAGYYSRDQLELLMMQLLRGITEDRAGAPGEGRLIEQLAGFLSASAYTLNRLNWGNLWSLRRAILIPEEFVALDQVLDAETRCRQCGGKLVSGEMMTFDSNQPGQRAGAGQLWCSRCSPMRKVKCTFEGCDEIHNLTERDIAALRKFRCAAHKDATRPAPRAPRPGAFANAVARRMQVDFEGILGAIGNGAGNVNMDLPQAAQQVRWGVEQEVAADPALLPDDPEGPF